MNFKKMISSFSHAFRGVQIVFKHEQNFRAQIILATLAIVASLVLQVRKYELLVVLLLVILVLLLEVMNTVAERFLDVLRPRMHHQVEIIKDIMAAAVLLASVGAVIIGLIIFVPYIIELL